jgi:hypothetical protein
MPRELPNFKCFHIPMEILIFYETKKKQGNQKRVIQLNLTTPNLPLKVGMSN